MVGGWAEHLQRRGFAATTVKRRRLIAAKWMRWCEASGIDPMRASSLDVERWLHGLRHRRTGMHLAPQSWDHYRGDLRSFYAWCVVQGHAMADPTEAVERPRRPTYLPRPISHDDLADAMSSADPTTRVVLALAALAGLRCAEIARLDATSVDLARRVLWVRQGKGGKDRVVPICDALAAELARYGIPRAGPVVSHGGGRPYAPGSLSSRMSRYLGTIGSASTLHALRHWFVTELVRGGADIRTVQELAGHSSLASTQVYAAVAAVDAAAAVASLAMPSRL